jgi:glucarate dehydratase
VDRRLVTPDEVAGHPGPGCRAVQRLGVLNFVEGAVRVPTTPGLGIELDLDALARLAEQYERCGFDTRDDITPMRAVQPDWDPMIPRW